MSTTKGTRKVVLSSPAECGVECTDALTWPGGSWTPGGDYPKKLLIRNVSPDVLILKYKLPVLRYFHMEFPEPLKIRYDILSFLN